MRFSHALHDYHSPEYNIRVESPATTNILIGGQSSADIRILNPIITESVVSIVRQDGNWKITPSFGVPFGVYLNANQITQGTLAKSGDFLTCLGLHLFFSDQHFLLSSDDDILIRTLYYSKEINQENHLAYPCLNRTTRIPFKKPTDEIHIQDPPSKPAENKNNIFISILPTAAMILLTLILRGSYGSGSQMIIFSTLSMSIGAVGSVLTYMQTGRERKSEIEKRNKNYQEYIDKQETKIKQARTEEHRILKSIYYDSETEIKNVMNFSATLFDRNPSDEDFLDIRFGYGKNRSEQHIIYKTHEVFEATDDLYEIPALLQQKYEFVDDLPVYVCGKNANAIGIVGDRQELQQMLLITSLDIATRQYFDDVKLFYLLSNIYTEELFSLRMLPHISNSYTQRRNLAYDSESRTFLLEYLYKELSEREDTKKVAENTPYLVLKGTKDQKIYIFDHYYRPLKEFNRLSPNIHYATDSKKVDELFDEVIPILKERKELTKLDGEIRINAFDPIIIIVNSLDTIKYVSSNTKLMAQFKTIAEDYKNMDIFFLFSDIPNKPINYASPNLIKMIGEEKRVLMFSDLSNIQAFSFDHNVRQAQRRSLAPAEVFFLNQNDIARIKLCDQ